MEFDKSKQYRDCEGDIWRFRDGLWEYSSDTTGHPDGWHDAWDQYQAPYMEYGPYEEVIGEEEEDLVNSPSHYEIVPGLEAINIIEALLTPEEFRGYLKGNNMKYLIRAGKKDDEIQDRRKAEWYNNKLVEKMEEGRV